MNLSLAHIEEHSVERELQQLRIMVESVLPKSLELEDIDLSRLDAKVNNTKDTEDPSCSAVDLQELRQLLQRKQDTSR